MTQTLPSDFLMPFGGDPINYAEDQRSGEALQKFLAQPNARAVLMHKGKAGIGEGLSLIHI